jgi:hypothetical protein
MHRIPEWSNCDGRGTYEYQTRIIVHVFSLLFLSNAFLLLYVVLRTSLGGPSIGHMGWITQKDREGKPLVNDNIKSEPSGLTGSDFLNFYPSVLRVIKPRTLA